MEQRFFQTFVVAEVAEIIDVPPGTIREWEKSLEGVLHIPRDQKGNRCYTEIEIQALRNIKAMRDKKLSFPIIRDLLLQAKNQANEEDSLALTVYQNQKVVLSQSEAIEKMHAMDDRLKNLEKENEMLKHLIEQLIQSNLSLESSVKELAVGQNLLTGRSEGFEELKKEIAASSDTVAILSSKVEELITLSRSEKHKRKKFLGLF